MMIPSIATHARSRGGERILKERIPGTKGQPHITIKNAGHFLQEDQPARLVAVINGDDAAD